jgi:hypothetical protein
MLELLIGNGTYYLQGENGWGERSCATRFASLDERSAALRRVRKTHDNAFAVDVLTAETAHDEERKRVVAFLRARSLESLELKGQVEDDYSRTVHSAQSIAHHDDAVAIERAEHWKGQNP